MGYALKRPRGGSSALIVEHKTLMRRNAWANITDNIAAPHPKALATASQQPYVTSWPARARGAHVRTMHWRTPLDGSFWAPSCVRQLYLKPSWVRTAPPQNSSPQRHEVGHEEDR